MRPRKLALLVAPALLLALVPGAATAAGPGKVAERAAYHAKVIRYWTPERVRNAVPRDFAFDRATGTIRPAAKPPGTPGGGGNGGGGGGGGGGSTLANTSGASWSGSAAVFYGTGKVLFTIGGGDYVCSGSVVDDGGTNNGQSIVLTAGHCAFENDGKTSATNWMFVPNFDASPTFTCSSTALGCWVADALYGRAEFYGAGGFTDTAVQHDWAFAVVGGAEPGKNAGAQLDAVVGGGFELVAGGATKGEQLTALGYPAAGKYNGRDLTYCRNPIGEDANTGNTTWSMSCQMTGGSSGGPWTQTTATTGGGYTLTNTDLVGLNSYGYSGVKNMYSPKFNAKTDATFASAKSGSLSSGVVRATP